MRKRLIAGNWKMNGVSSKTSKFFNELKQLLPGQSAKVERLLALPSTSLHLAPEIESDYGIQVAAQNIHQAAEGAFTGEISAAMIADHGVRTALIGHSERRQYFNETLDSVQEKLVTCFKTGIRPILCIGETLEQRDSGDTEKVLTEQLAGLFDTAASGANFVIAYEPVWAIGTGKSASPEDAQQTHAFLRQLLKQKLGSDSAEQVLLLYGGSAKPSNIGDLIEQSDIDGALIGGASLKPADFAKMIEIAQA